MCTLEGVRQDVHYHTIGQVCVYFPNCLSLYVIFFLLLPFFFFLFDDAKFQASVSCLISPYIRLCSELFIEIAGVTCSVLVSTSNWPKMTFPLHPPNTDPPVTWQQWFLQDNTTSTRLVVSQSENEGCDGVCRHLSIFLTLPFSFFIVFFYRSLIKANYFSRVCKPRRGDRVLPVERLQSLRVAHPFLMQFEVSVSPPEKRFLHGHWVWVLLPFKSPGLDFECQLADLLSVPWLSRLECVSVYYKAFQMFFIGLCTEWCCRR